MQVVRIDKLGRVLDGVVAVSKSDKENVIWVALGKGGPWKITFDKPGGVGGSPFDETEYLVGRGNFAVTMNGPRTATSAGQTYKYRVRDATNPNNATNITDDPDVDIE